jgi:hypothetical protein
VAVDDVPSAKNECRTDYQRSDDKQRMPRGTAITIARLYSARNRKVEIGSIAGQRKPNCDQSARYYSNPINTIGSRRGCSHQMYR